MKLPKKPSPAKVNKAKAKSKEEAILDTPGPNYKELYVESQTNISEAKDKYEELEKSLQDKNDIITQKRERIIVLGEEVESVKEESKKHKRVATVLAWGLLAMIIIAIVT